MKSMIIMLCMSFVSASAFAASSKFLNLRYGVMGPMLELGYGKFGLGVTTMSASYDGTSLAPYTAKSTLLGGRASLYSNGMGMSSWYLAVDAGSVDTDFSETISSVTYTAKSTATYAGGSVGYHWFWNYFNLNLGLGTLSMSFNDTSVKTSAGTVGDTIPGFSISLPIIDLGIGIAF